MTLPEDGNRYAQIDRFRGLRSVQRFEMLAFLVWRNGWKTGAELGVHLGTTSEYLLKHFPDLSLVGVDFFGYPPHEVFGPARPSAVHEEKRAKVEAIYAQYGTRARLIAKPTHEAAAEVAAGSLDFIFVDADHRYESVKDDIARWMPKLKPSGWMIGHDYLEHFDGVFRAVNEAFGGRHFALPKTLWAVRRDMSGC
jgi:predicted O-methyltransferase YrrM